MTRTPARARGTLLLDSQGLALLVQRDIELTQWVMAARKEKMSVQVSAATLVEVIYPGIRQEALHWALSRIVVVPVTYDIVRSASQLLADCGRHGHTHAIDAIVAATAMAIGGPATVLTSDPQDLSLLCGEHVTIAAI